MNDFHILNGSHHKCECGKTFTDSDGGCCDICTGCGALCDAGSLSDDGYCQDCIEGTEQCIECMTRTEVDDLDHGLCKKCEEPELITACAWCKGIMNGGDVVRVATKEEYQNASHGICAPCKENVMRESRLSRGLTD